MGFIQHNIQGLALILTRTSKLLVEVAMLGKFRWSILSTSKISTCSVMRIEQRTESDVLRHRRVHGCSSKWLKMGEKNRGETKQNKCNENKNATKLAKQSIKREL